VHPAEPIEKRKGTIAMNSLTLISCGVTAAFAILIACDTTTNVHATPMVSPSKQILAGKALTVSDHCTQCHGANLTGQTQFSPSLRTTGVLKEYNKKTFETVLFSGKTNDGGMVSNPMPVYKMKAALADDIYDYLKTLK
jgi:cytochrome c553